MLQRKNVMPLWLICNYKLMIGKLIKFLNHYSYQIGKNTIHRKAHWMNRLIGTINSTEKKLPNQKYLEYDI